MGSIVGLLIELVVVVLLGFTVAYCIILDRRLQRLRQDETAMRQTVVDLGLATDRAERAIDGLRQLMADCDTTLGDRLRAAQTANADLEDSIRSGSSVLERIALIVSNSNRKPVVEPDYRPEPEPHLTGFNNVSETLAAAEAFAMRARRKIMTNAA
jgi:hypothetical protein